MNVLFICSRNQWRSPTAEMIFRDHPVVNARSAGTSSSARIKVTEKLILWSDVIFAMERKHRDLLLERFPSAAGEKQIVLLDIPDEYQYMDEELIEEIRSKTAPYFS
ncbi:MAG: low molecular weight protein tyrosine phosphatase family protein [Bacteroidia bacterium]